MDSEPGLIVNESGAKTAIGTESVIPRYGSDLNFSNGNICYRGPYKIFFVLFCFIRAVINGLRVIVGFRTRLLARIL